METNHLTLSLSWTQFSTKHHKLLDDTKAHRKGHSNLSSLMQIIYAKPISTPYTLQWYFAQSLGIILSRLYKKLK